MSFNMRKLALKISRKAVTLTFFCLLASLYLLTLLSRRYLSQLPWYTQPAPCLTPKLIFDEMIELTFAASSLLTKLNISHTLCYGTLWGALRYGKTLPWDNNVDFCVLKNEIQKVPWAIVYGNFKANSMDIIYNPRQGEYIINRGSAQAALTVFYKTQLGDALRDGFEHKFLWFFQSNPVSFPSSLIQPPFNTITFHGRPMPVPHSDMEMLKYLYQDDWWLEKPPPGCPRGKT